MGKNNSKAEKWYVISMYSGRAFSYNKKGYEDDHQLPDKYPEGTKLDVKISRIEGTVSVSINGTSFI